MHSNCSPHINAHPRPDRGEYMRMSDLRVPWHSNIMRNVNSSGCDRAAHLLMHFHPCICGTGREKSVNNTCGDTLSETTTNTRNRLRSDAQNADLPLLHGLKHRDSPTSINLPSISFHSLCFSIHPSEVDCTECSWVKIICSSVIFSFICFCHGLPSGDWGNRRFTPKTRSKSKFSEGTRLEDKIIRIQTSFGPSGDDLWCDQCSKSVLSHRFPFSLA